MLGVCLVDMNKSTITMLTCPECGSNVVGCHENPHLHLCLACYFATSFDDEDEEEDGDEEE